MSSSLPRLLRPPLALNPRRPSLPYLRRLASSSSGVFQLDPRLKKGDKVVVSMSGGVDSSVVLRLLADHDLDLSAVFMRNWSVESQDSLRGCEWEKDFEDVQRVCSHVGGVPVKLVDLSKDYWLQVFEPSLDSWAQGTTPNPDVLCNKEIKFGKLMDKVLPKDAFIATGHYAQVRTDENSQRARLYRNPDPIKDQSYFLSAVSSSALSRTVFPLGGMFKSHVKQLARDFGLPTAGRKESMGICFVENKRGRHFPEKFLSQYIPPSPGLVLTPTGDIFDRHQGLHSYTIGQKFPKAGLKEGEGKWFVVAKEREANRLVVAQGSDNPLLRSSSFKTHSWNWVARQPPPDLAQGLKVRVKIMSVSKAVEAIIQSSPSGRVRVTYADPKGEVVTPGQICVAYLEDGECLGGGEICERGWVWEEGVRLPPRALE